MYEAAQGYFGQFLGGSPSIPGLPQYCHSYCQHHPLLGQARGRWGGGNVAIGNPAESKQYIKNKLNKNILIFDVNVSSVSIVLRWNNVCK